MHDTFLFAFSSRFAKIRSYDFRQVVWQHIEGVVGCYIGFIESTLLQHWNNFKFKNWHKVIAMSLVYNFLGHSVYILCARCSGALRDDVATGNKTTSHWRHWSNNWQV